jgi:septum site-determining protein MinD
MLAIAGGKGGTGKTTTALGLGALLASRRRDPVVVDADVDMPNLHLRAGADDEGLTRLATGDPLADAADESNRYPGVDVVGARPGTDLDRALRALVTDRPVVVDCAAGASERAVTPLRYAEAAVVVTSETSFSVTDARKTARMARAVGTPVVAAVVSRASDVSDTIAAALPTDAIIPVPTVEDPIRHPTARAAYSRILDTWINA